MWLSQSGYLPTFHRILSIVMNEIKDGSGSALEFYDGLADSYHLIGANWDEMVRTQGQILDKLIRGILPSRPVKILDCSCGIGTQAIGLALQGHEVRATDLSPKAIARAELEAARLGAAVSFGIADFRRLENVAGRYDVVISGDNSLPHLLTEDALLLALKNIRSKSKAEGMVLFSVRDYDKILETKPTGMLPRTFEDKDGKRIYFQTWDWSDKSPVYKVNLYILCEIDPGWETKSFVTTYRAWRKDEISVLMARAGFDQVRWLFPQETGYYQPVVIARVGNTGLGLPAEIASRPSTS
jgi:glycine/sarcosine N-methyltransferase